jgi:hypothetical protein
MYLYISLYIEIYIHILKTHRAESDKGEEGQRKEPSAGGA